MNNIRKDSMETMHNGENPHHLSSHHKEDQILSRRDIMTICIAAVILSILAGTILILLIFFFGLSMCFILRFYNTQIITNL